MSAEQMHTPWRVEIKYGPEGEESYAWVVTSDNTMIGTFKTHHAQIVARAVNSFASSQERIARLVGELRRITDHLEEWARYHSDERTAETDAAIYCARRVIACAAPDVGAAK